MSQCYQRCFYPAGPPCSTTYCSTSGEDCPIRRNRSCCDYFPTQKLGPPPMMTVGEEVQKKQQTCGCSPSGLARGKRKREDILSTGQVCFAPKNSPNPQKKPQCCPMKQPGAKTVGCPMGKSYSSRSSKKHNRKQSSSKQTKNKQNYQYQDMLGKSQMESISEEHENDRDDECYCDGPDGFNGSERSKLFVGNESKKIQESCADFLSIMNDTVLDTVQVGITDVDQSVYDKFNATPSPRSLLERKY